MKKRSSLAKIFRKALPWIALSGTAAVVIWTLFYWRPDFSQEDVVVPLNSGRGVRKFAVCIVWTTFLFAWLAQIRRIPRIIFLSVIFLPAAAVTFVAHVYKIDYDYNLVADIIQTRPEEAFEFVDFWAIFALVGFFAAMTALGIALEKMRPAFPRRKIVLWAMPIVLFALCFTGIKNNICMSALVIKTKDYVQRSFLRDEFGIIKALKNLEDAPAQTTRLAGTENDSPIVFLHIGESARADHAPFNGYERDTMPRMNREFRAGTLVSFPKCVSFSIRTRFSVLGILTPATVLDPVIRAASFVPALKDNKIFLCGFFSSMSKQGGFHDISLMALTDNFHRKIHTREMSDSLFQRVSEEISGAPRESFFLYYGEGAHMPATRYNREKYDVFTPSAKHGIVKNESRVNAYDNCMVATDDFCGNAIEALRGKNAVYIYVSDHGDMLGEDGFWTRNAACSHRPEVRHVLCFVWCSEKFRETHPEKFKTLQENRARLGIISHDFIYHTVLGLYGIRTPHYAETLDLFSPKAEAFPRERRGNFFVAGTRKRNYAPAII